MKTWLIVSLLVVVGLGLGIVLAVANSGLLFEGDPLARPTLDEDRRFPSVPDAGEASPRLVVDDPVHDFGTVEEGATLTHDFVVRNEGDAPLVLRRGETTCKCTIAGLESEEVPPGGSTVVTLEWTVRADISERYSQQASIFTNDPERRLVEFTVKGQRKRTVYFEPPSLSFSKTSADERILTVRLLASHEERLEIESFHVEQPETAELFDVAWSELPDDELKPSVASGCLVAVTVKPGLPMGRVAQQIRFETNVSDLPPLVLNVHGSIDSDIVVAGRDWNSRAEALTIGAVRSGSGASRKLVLTVRGPYRDQVEFRVLRVDPELMQVTIGPASDIAGGRVKQVPLTVEIPPGSPAVNRLGSHLGEAAEIVLETNHPQAPELTLQVRFAIEG